MRLKFTLRNKSSKNECSMDKHGTFTDSCFTRSHSITGMTSSTFRYHRLRAIFTGDFANAARDFWAAQEALSSSFFDFRSFLNPRSCRVVCARLRKNGVH